MQKRDVHPTASSTENELTRRTLLKTTAASAALVVPTTATIRPAGAVLGRPSRLHETGRREQTLDGAGLSRARLERMHEVLASYVERERLPGLVTGLNRRGEIHVDVIGMTAFENGDPMRRDTIFRLASVSKPIVAAAAMTLVEESALRLDDPVDELLPELADRKVLRSIESPLDDTVPANRPITLRDMLTLRLGYGAIFTPPDQSPLAQALIDAGVAAGPNLPTLPPDDFMKVYSSLPLAHQPGEKWLYNTGLDMLGVLMARATGKSLGELLQERIFAPLGMNDTGFFVPADKLDRLAGSYWTDFTTGEFGVFDSAEESQFAQPPVFESGAGGLVSTVDDLLAFGEMMFNNGKYGDERILSRPSIELMTTDQITPEQKSASKSEFFPGFWDSHGWGFGMAIDTRRDNLWQTPGRYGWDGGYGTSWYVDPTEELIGILLTQRVWDEFPIPRVYIDFWTAAYAAIND
jgi:CubicO group peptidase (beta-lactamase class C family)